MAQAAAMDGLWPDMAAPSGVVRRRDPSHGPESEESFGIAARPGIPVALSEWVPMVLGHLRDMGTDVVRPRQVAQFIGDDASLAAAVLVAQGAVQTLFAGARQRLYVQDSGEDGVPTLVLRFRLPRYPADLGLQLESIWRLYVDTLQDDDRWLLVTTDYVPLVP